MRNSLFFIVMLVSSMASAVEIFPLIPEGFRFREKYPEVQKLLFAFDYGHARAYERLLNRKGTVLPSNLEDEMLSEIFGVLKNMGNTKVHEQDLAPFYVKNFSLAVDIFDWSHLLHQWVYDVLAISTDRGDAMKERINQIYDIYKANHTVVITDKCKSMLFMTGHPYSKTFFRKFLRYNFLIWVYHWFQIKLYEDLMLPTQVQRDSAVHQTVQEFWDRISDLPDSAGFDMMPLMEDEAPTFVKAFPKISATFNTNHMLHDIVSDILVSDLVPMEKIQEEGIKVARMTQNPEAFALPVCPGEKP